MPGLPSPCLAGLFRPEIYLTPEAAADPATRSALSCGTSWRISARRTSCGASCGSSASASTGLTPSSGWPRRWPGGTASWRATRGCCAGWTASSRAAYGRALLGLVTAKPGGGQLLSGATTMQLGKKSLKERITLIAKKPKMAAYTLVFVLLLCLALAACTFTGASAQPEPEPETAQPEVQPQPAPEPEPTADTEAPQPVEDDPEAGFQMAFPMLELRVVPAVSGGAPGDAGGRLGAHPHQRSGL